MTNADKFKSIFGIYATELWAKSEEEFLEWLNSETEEQEKAKDAVPVIHGRWIIRDNPGTEWYRVTCSECGEDVTATAPCIGFFPNAKVIWDYCPFCGAKMDEGKDE